MRVISQSGGRVMVVFSSEEWEVARAAVEDARSIEEEDREVSEACRVDIEYARGDSDYLAGVAAERARARIGE